MQESKREQKEWRRREFKKSFRSKQKRKNDEEKMLCMS
jgi:hypothetical protein